MMTKLRRQVDTEPWRGETIEEERNPPDYKQRNSAHGANLLGFEDLLLTLVAPSDRDTMGVEASFSEKGGGLTFDL